MRLTRREFVASAAALLSLRTGTCQMTKPTEVPWLSAVQRPPDKLPDDAPKLPPLLVDAAGRGIDTLDAWKRRRVEVRKWWTDFLGTLKVERPKPTLEVLKEDRPEGCIRQWVRYESEPGIPVEGYLLRPANAAGRRPGVVAMHSTVNHTIRQPAGVEGKGEKAFALKLARRGCVAFCPKCFLWVGRGRYTRKVSAFRKRHPGVTGMAKMLWDTAGAVDVLESLPDVDPKRLGAVGHSLGAKEALYLAAFDERIKVTVSSEGGIGTRFSNWDAPWYLGKAIRKKGFAHEHHELLALVAPRAFLLLAGDSADGARSWPFIEAALGVYRLYGRTPRVGLLNHRRGHSVPPEAEKRIYEWFAAYL